MPHAFRIFSSAVDARRVRRPTDVVLLILALLSTIGLAFAAPGPTALDSSVTAVLGSLPGVAGWLWELSYGLLVVWAAALAIIVLAHRGHRRIFGDLVLAAALALGSAVLAGWVAGTSVSDSIRALLTPGPPAVYLETRIALVTAIVVVASPHLSRPLRYVGRGILAMGAAASVALGVALPIGAVAGFVIGVGCAAIAHLILGSPGGRPSAAQVTVALGDLGVEVTQVVESLHQVTGVAMFDASTPSGEQLLVKVYGKDAWDGQLLTSTWTALQTRGETPRLGTSALARVEHEAVVTLLAERGGVPVLPVLAVGRSAEGDAVLVSQVTGTALRQLDPDQLDDAVLASAWRALAGLHDLGISHGSVDGDRIIVRADNTPALADLAEAQLAADTDAQLTDRARLLVTLALVVGHERAVASAGAVIGAEGLAAVLPFLQPAVLDRSTRRAVRQGDWSLDDLSAAAVSVAGVEPPELQKIQRVTVRSTLTVVLIAVLAYYIISKLANVDFASIVDELSSANFWWLLAALLVSPMVQVSLSFSTLGAAMAALRYWPVLMLQYAIQFTALVLPASAARVALEIRFFQRYGLAAAAAVSIGVVDSVSGFTVQIALILIIVLSGLPGLTSTTTSTTTSSSSDSSTPSLILVAIAIAVLGAVITAVVPKLRNRARETIPRIRAALRDQAVAARGALTVLRHPAKVGQMLGGNLGAQLLQAIILGLCLAAFGETAYLSQLILINTAVSLFAGMMPVPGGMGVAEAGYTAGLQAIGVPSAIAISTAIAFRLVTFYLPPLWGAFAMRWLRRHSYV